MCFYHIGFDIALQIREGHFEMMIKKIAQFTEAEFEKYMQYRTIYSDNPTTTLMIEQSQKTPVLIRIQDFNIGYNVIVFKNVDYKNYSKRNFDYFIYVNGLYQVKDMVTEEEAALSIMDLHDSERRKFERLKNKFSGKKETKYERTRIPENVRVEVWRRDQGACVQCSSREKLEYDHIVPVSKGGSNTARNVELLCEECNRKKSDNIQ